LHWASSLGGPQRVDGHNGEQVLVAVFFDEWRGRVATR